MPLAGWVNNLDKRFAWSLYGFVLAAVFGAFTIYIEFIRDERPAVQMEVISNFNVLDVKEDVPDLSVTFAGTDLKESGQSLRIIVIRIRNVGMEDILKSYYDENAPLGFVVGDGSIISVEIQETSESYLSTNLQVSRPDANSVTFSPVILGPGQYFTIKTLIIHPESTVPNITPTGKVARVSSITAISSEDLEPPGFWSQVFSGSYLVQFVRLPIYFLALVLAVIAIAVPISVAGSAIAKKNRRKKVNHFQDTTELKLRSSYDLLFSSYVETGDAILFQVARLLHRPDDIDNFAIYAKKMEGKVDLEPFDFPHEMFVEEQAGRRVSRMFSPHLIRRMMRASLITKVDGQFRIDPEFVTVFNEFKHFVA